MAIWAAEPTCRRGRGADARSSRGRRSTSGADQIRGPACREDRADAAGSDSPLCEPTTGQAFPAWCRAREPRPCALSVPPVITCPYCISCLSAIMRITSRYAQCVLMQGTPNQLLVDCLATMGDSSTYLHRELPVGIERFGVFEELRPAHFGSGSDGCYRRVDCFVGHLAHRSSGRSRRQHN